MASACVIASDIIGRMNDPNGSNELAIVGIKKEAIGVHVSEPGPGLTPISWTEIAESSPPKSGR